MSLRSRRRKWSLIRYDLKTGLDILKLPCLVKVAEDTAVPTFDDNPSRETTSSCAIKFEKETCVCFIRARVLELPDEKWFLRKKGEDFVKSYNMMTDSEILIPLEYGGRVRLFERSGGQNYYSIREVIEDFPRFVRVEKDTICASPGVKGIQIVEKGSILELDRVTKSMQAVRGSRETFLICKDNVNSRELAFRQMTPVHFTKASDMTKYNLKDFIERLPLPQTVEFVDVNPYDVISVDDDDARELLLILGGRMELLSLQMENFIAGTVDNSDINVCDIVAVPVKESALESFFIHLSVDNENEKRITAPCAGGEYVDLTVTNDVLYSCLQQKLYLRYAYDEAPLFLRLDNCDNLKYEFEEMPDTPPIPERLDDYMLKHATSTSNFEEDPEKRKRLITRRRVFSANDIDRTSVQQRQESQNGFKPFLHQLSRRMKTTASHILFGIEAFSGAVDQDLENVGKDHKTGRDLNIHSGFICYLDLDIKTHPSLESQLTPGERNMNKSGTTKEEEEVIYASVDLTKKKGNKCTSSAYRCPICKDTT